MDRLADFAGPRGRGAWGWGPPATWLVVQALLLSSVSAAFAQRAAWGPLREAARARSERCNVPDVRGYGVSYARELIHESHCSLGTVGPAVRSRRSLVVLGESPRPGTLARVGQRVNLRLGPRPRGCAAPHFHVQAHTAGLYVWTEVFGNPDESLEQESSRTQLEACVPPAGPVATVFSGFEDRSFTDLETAGHTLAFLETESDQYETSVSLVAFDLDRSSVGPELSQPVADGGPPPGEGYADVFPDGLDGYAIDASGDIAWIQEYYSLTRALYVFTGDSNAAVKVEEGDLGDVGLTAGELTWTNGGQARSEAIAALM